MNEWMAGIGVAVVGWMGSVEFRLGQLLKMQSDVSETKQKVNSLYEHLVERALSDAGKTEKRPQA
jgi:hypothetical protein